MKTTAKITLTPNAKVLVDVGDEINRETVLASEDEKDKDTRIDLSGILKVTPSGIFRYIKKRPQDAIKEGDILAEKRTFLTTLTVRSPVNGKVKEIDLKSGILSISKDTHKSSKNISVPYEGKVKDISKTFIEIELKGLKVTGVTGSGKECSGRLQRVTHERSGLFDFDTDVQDCIIMIKEAFEDIQIKLDVLGAAGLVATKAAGETELSRLIVSEDDFAELSKHDKKIAWMRPQDKEIFILSS
ncbi:hypothetical protein A3D05_04140 [Candidatus Gottesmanbacteria bacterium RIFCSPHIGHO2_02_FULL_40_24]|uniref:Uncharacterized protein n=1 Tax=Candidatus Gottesmanbacteria bacterium RIFCSPHIGHO2_01_FULL_40_15 TaxID=1798376 RepID=A0A1F5Z138_9BACT|nr:MAG: hypothetical protein A2777_00930 [Candidatus Gottesmanbacteria bacterium RIFCSPHIGHO2_01_FULL_40_15]OGG17495.1 MAG: hypothetical protein A3D05_04140 [Candidatus Gottesmanbacteria bacterium RIFCSPHIGHO2_02_FULL_40_24]OGG21500.1 MAG: hypothetical protein A3B48_01765 [Candidatus Gottesmanbacteria bacterium RIFCSPLOWO2_01_FULL_40_10]OGG25138.1 MAG: hypothetical protein A3E42_01055 [Candidatus Gottesmanbacteria bacterium RIFCSPHIGHO2_12_FULL_40_13]OGG32742.1 MAG: hypothetical protein A3I80_0